MFAIHAAADDPREPEAAIMFILSAVTDGVRGFLIISGDFAPPDTEREVAELMESVRRGAPRGDDYAICVAAMHERDERSPGLLDLSRPDTARSVIEAAYDRAFTGKEPIDHAAFFEHFAPFGWPINDEADERERCRMLDCVLPA